MTRQLLKLLLVLALAIPAYGVDPTAADINSWIEQLDSDRFEIREYATQRLVNSGPPAVDALREHVLLGGVESATRGLAVLRELALQDHQGAVEAEQTIQQLAEGRATSSSHHAATVLQSLHGIRTSHGIKILKRLGATFTSSISAYDERRTLGGAGLYIGFGESWRGTAEDLEYLRWITESDGLHVTLAGKTFDDVWLEKLVESKNIVSLQLNRVGITDDGMQHLAKLSKLSVLVLRYNSISDESLPSIEAALKETELGFISVFGTGMSKPALDKLAADHTALTLRYRRGGFLGVSGSGINGMGCYISTVTPNHAAARAGITPGDMVIAYRGKKVTSFSRTIPPSDNDDGEPTLAELIGEDPAGTKVEVTIKRGNETLLKQVTLGEWP